MENINISSHTHMANSFSFSGDMNPVCSYAEIGPSQVSLPTQKNGNTVKIATSTPR
jgi:hypothetical protein